MTKKKPDFLRDLDTAIMDELTGGGIKGNLLVYILADFVAVSEKAVEQDEAAVRGVIANKPTYRETPRGKRITDITVKVRNELTGGSCFLPCICWQEQADEAAQW